MDKALWITNFIIASTATLGFVMIILYVLNKDGVKDTLSNSGQIYKNISDKIAELLADLSKMITPKMGTSLRDTYEKMLLYSDTTVEKLFQIKNALCLIGFIFMTAMAFTNMRASVDKLYTTFEYVKSPLVNLSKYTEDDKKRILKEKNKMFDLVLQDIGADNLGTFDDSDAENIIKSYIKDLDNTTGMDLEVLSTEILAKVKAYNKAQHVNLLTALLVAIIMYIIPEVYIYVMKFLNKSKERAEKRFLKRLIIMNGSIKPTDFMMVLAELIDKSRFFKKILLEIEDYNKKNYEENTKIYTKYIREAEDVETKLFFEKLDEANNYDFDQAIINIKNEFNLDKRMQTRKCKKMVETIHVWGLLGFMGLICLIIFYLLMPWLTAYDIGSIM